MKKRVFSLLLVVLLFVCLFPFSVPAASAADVTVRLAPDAGETEQAAAAVLQDYLEQITGTRPPR